MEISPRLEVIWEANMENVIDFAEKKKEKEKKEEARLTGNILKRIKHLLPENQEDENPNPHPPEAS